MKVEINTSEKTIFINEEKVDLKELLELFKDLLGKDYIEHGWSVIFKSSVNISYPVIIEREKLVPCPYPYTPLPQTIWCAGGGTGNFIDTNYPTISLDVI